MSNLVKVISTEFDIAKKRIVKVLRFGKGDVQTPIESSPYGIDSNPIKDMVAVYSPTGEKGKPVIIGYLNKNQKASVGELRTYATDASGTEKFYTWMKADGTMEIGGNVDWMVRFSKLKAAFDELKADFNRLVALYNAHVHSATPIPVTGSTAPPAILASASTANIDPAKIDQIKTL